jgi:NADPH:quinone reductase-like Zn-dependent oxidoreductase
VHALTISAHGGLEQIVFRGDLPTPEIAHDTDVRVRITAAALNHLDLFVVAGLPGVTITPPWTLGCDATGVVDAVGARVKTVAVGDTVVINAGVSDGTCEYCRDGEQPLCPRFGVLGEHKPGLFSEHVVVPAKNVRVVPASIPKAEAAAFTLTSLTAWRMVVSRANVTAGDEVLIWGIGGGVALAALQICKARGARVWVTSRDPGKLERARALGADELLDANADVGKAVRDRTNKRGVDVVIDNVGQATWKHSLGALGRRGRLVTCGGTSGPMVETDVRRLFWNQWTIMGSTMGNDAEFDAVVAELIAGRMRAVVDSVYPIAEGRKAYERLASGQQFGKVVLDVAP